MIVDHQTVCLPDQECPGATYYNEVPYLGKSKKGMMNTEYKRYLARIPKTYAIVKLGYSADVYDIEPALIQPAFIQCVEPSDDDIVRVMKVGSLGSLCG